MNAAGKSGLGFIFDERDNKNILFFILRFTAVRRRFLKTAIIN